MSRIAALVAVLLAAGCIDKPLRPSERDTPDGGGGEADAGGGCGAEPADQRMGWLETDEIRFNQRVGQIDGDCRDDLVIAGSRAAGAAPGVFVVLGREAGFMEGFDDFIDTPNGEKPVDLTLARLVGGDSALDLMVVASKDQDTVVLVYKGKGDGGFTFLSQKTIESLELQAGGAEYPPAPLFVLVAQLEPDGPPSLVLGDAVTTRILSPTSWDEPAAITGADVFTPPEFNQDGGTQEVGIVGAPDREVDDLFDMAAVNARWYGNQDGVDAFVRSPGMDPGIEGPGPSVFLDIDSDGDPDVTSVRVEGAPQLETLVLEPSSEPGNFGTIAATARLDRGLSEAGTSFSDFALLDLGGGSEPDAVLVDPAFEDGARTGTSLAVYPDLTVDGSLVMSAGPPITFVSEHPLGDGDPDRLAIGRFAEDTFEILVMSRAPFETGVCHRIVRDPFSFEPCQ